MTTRKPFEHLTPAERDAITAWLIKHNLDPDRTPIDALIEEAPDFGEYRVEQFAPGPDGGVLVVDGEVVRRVVRRRKRPDTYLVPWPEVRLQLLHVGPVLWPANPRTTVEVLR